MILEQIADYADVIDVAKRRYRTDRAHLIVVRDLAKERDGLIFKAYADGIPAPVIAKAAGISRQRVYQIIETHLLSE